MFVMHTNDMIMKYPNIRVLRDRLNLKQEFVASCLGIEQPEYSRIENGKRDLKAGEAQRLAEILQTSVEVLLGGAIHREPLNYTGDRFSNRDSVSRELLNRMMEQNQQLLLQLIKSQEQHHDMVNRIIGRGLSNG